MKWANFEETDKEYPEKLVEKSIEGFSKATKGLAELKISELNDINRIMSKVEGDFIFNVWLVSPYVKEYMFKVLTFGYDIQLNPINIRIEDSIYQEIVGNPVVLSKNIVCKDDLEFSSLLEKVFSSNKFVETVTGLMKIARKNQK